MRKLIFDEKTGKVYSEPKYSVVELEKISKKLIENNEFVRETRNPYGGSLTYISTDGSCEVRNFIEILKNREKVQEILNER